MNCKAIIDTIKKTETEYGQFARFVKEKEFSAAFEIKHNLTEALKYWQELVDFRKTEFLGMTNHELKSEGFQVSPMVTSKDREWVYWPMLDDHVALVETKYVDRVGRRAFIDISGDNFLEKWRHNGCIFLSPDNKKLGVFRRRTTGGFQDVTIYGLENDEKKGIYNRESMNALTFTPDNRILAANHRTIGFLEESGRIDEIYFQENGFGIIWGLSVTSDGRYAILLGDKLNVFDLEERTFRFDLNAECYAHNPADPNQIYLYSDTMIRTVNLETGESDEFYAAVPLARNKKMVASPDGKFVIIASRDALEIFDVERKKMVRWIDNDEDPSGVIDLTITPDGKIITMTEKHFCVFGTKKAHRTEGKSNEL